MISTRALRAYLGVGAACSVLCHACASVGGKGHSTEGPDGDSLGGASGSASSGGGQGDGDATLGGSGVTSGRGRGATSQGTGSGASSGQTTTQMDAGTSTGSGSSNSSGGPPVTGTGPKIPLATGTCPKLATGNITVMGQTVQLWVGAKQTNKRGAVLFYWHSTGSTSSEATSLMDSQIQEITAEGGIVASFETTTAMGENTGKGIWYTGDYAMADQILACAVQQLNIDTRRIYTSGCSAGGLQAGVMLYARSSYLAAVMPNGGGTVLTSFALDDPSHVPALITAHGAPSTDSPIVDFTQASAIEDKDVVSKGGTVVDCNHGGGICSAPASVIAAQWQFCNDHPFGVSPEPYANGLPSGFPSACKIISTAGDASAD